MIILVRRIGCPWMVFSQQLTTYLEMYLHILYRGSIDIQVIQACNCVRRWYSNCSLGNPGHTVYILHEYKVSAVILQQLIQLELNLPHELQIH